MAGGKLTPRQKMINLMYLVFIAMLALNMSKEVLSAFGILNNKIESSNSITDTRNESSFLECEPAEKRIIVENLLSLEIYREYFEITKNLKKELTRILDTFERTKFFMHYYELEKALGGKGASDKVAKLIYESL